MGFNLGFKGLIWIKTACIITGGQDSNQPEKEQIKTDNEHFLYLHRNPSCWHSHQNINTVAHCNWSNDMITNAQNSLKFFNNGTELIWSSKALVKNLWPAQLISTKRARAVIAVHPIKALGETEVYLHTFLTSALNLWPAQLISTKRARAVMAVHPIKALRETEVYLQTFLTSALNLWPAKLISTKRARAVIAVHPTKALRGTEVYLHTFLTLALNTDEWPASCHDLFTPKERVPGIHWTSTMGGAMSWYECSREPPASSGNSTPTLLLASHYTDWAIYPSSLTWSTG